MKNQRFGDVDDFWKYPEACATWAEPGEVRGAHGHQRGDTARPGAGPQAARGEREGASPRHSVGHHLGLET